MIHYQIPKTFTPKFKVGKIVCVIDQWKNYYLAHENVRDKKDNSFSVRNFTTYTIILNGTSFEEVEQNGEDFINVKKGGMWNVINVTTEKYVTKQWFDSIGTFKKVYDYGSTPSQMFSMTVAMVQRGKKYNYLNAKGWLISRKWYDYLGEFTFSSPWAVAKRDGKYNYINAAGYTKFNRWCDFCRDFTQHGYALVHNAGKSFIVDSCSDTKHTLAELRKTWKDCVLDEMMGFK